MQKGLTGTCTNADTVTNTDTRFFLFVYFQPTAMWVNIVARCSARFYDAMRACKLYNAKSRDVEIFPVFVGLLGQNVCICVDEQRFFRIFVYIYSVERGGFSSDDLLYRNTISAVENYVTRGNCFLYIEAKTRVSRCIFLLSVYTFSYNVSSASARRLFSHE